MSRKTDDDSRAADFNEPVERGRIDEILKVWGKDDTPGVAATVVHRGRVLYEGCFGKADLARGTDISVNTVFELASVTKPLTALAVMMLKDRGALRYEETLADIFPEFQKFGDAAREITARHLLTHTSGLPEYSGLLAKDSRFNGEFTRRTIDIGRSSAAGRARFEPTSEDVVTALSQLESISPPPRNKFSYSNTGYSLLSQVIARRSGRDSYAEFMREEIFKPLKMSAFVLERPGTPDQNWAVSYDRGWCDYHDIDYTPLNFISGDGSVRATLADMSKLAVGLDAIQWPNEGHGVEALVKEATFADAIDYDTTVWTDIARNTSYGFGWFANGVRTARGDRRKKVIWHDGGWVGFKTMLMRFPEDGLTIILLSNISHFPGSAVACLIARLYLNVEERQFPTFEADDLQKFVKTYTTNEQANSYGADVDVTLEPESRDSTRMVLWMKTPDLEKFQLVPFVRGDREGGKQLRYFYRKGMEGLDLYCFSFKESPDPVVSEQKLINPPNDSRLQRQLRHKVKSS